MRVKLTWVYKYHKHTCKSFLTQALTLCLQPRGSCYSQDVGYVIPILWVILAIVSSNNCALSNWPEMCKTTWSGKELRINALTPLFACPLNRLPVPRSAWLQGLSGTGKEPNVKEPNVHTYVVWFCLLGRTWQHDSRHKNDTNYLTELDVTFQHEDIEWAEMTSTLKMNNDHYASLRNTLKPLFFQQRSNVKHHLMFHEKTKYEIMPEGQYSYRVRPFQLSSPGALPCTTWHKQAGDRRTAVFVKWFDSKINNSVKKTVGIIIPT